ncbi:alpha/beta fold hydrolase [Bradyrhizobium zhanjiangense]|uniref:alpha/beta fold hydrolase n=1 Tax=Bradyrhizobium zhanjiangense TaxID=1325107 RepID=UPI001FE1918D|nr:alpha/beta hydrolase [Bradyrhizobium zhanjiangense]
MEQRVASSSIGKPDSPSLQHATADIEPGVSIHYVVAGSGPRTVVLLHGFPQTWRAWRHIIPRLANAGFRVIAPDYRGAGNSSKPLSGYDKRTMATDIYRLLYEHLKLSCPVAMVGHDIGLMVAYAFAQTYHEDVTHLVAVDAPLPGTAIFDQLSGNSRNWQFSFHKVRDLPELLVSGREREYLQWFFNFRISNPAAITEADFRDYLTAYTAPGAMRAAFELYRSFDQDSKDNRDLLASKGKLRIPVLVAVGATSPTASPVRGMMEEVSIDPRVLPLPGAGHWIAEENPEGFAAGLIDFMGPHR